MDIFVVVVEGCLFQPPHSLSVDTNFPIIKCNGVSCIKIPLEMICVLAVLEQDLAS